MQDKIVKGYVGLGNTGEYLYYDGIRCLIGIRETVESEGDYQYIVTLECQTPYGDSAKDEEDAVTAACISILDSLGVKGMNDYDKVRKIHGWLSTHVTYGKGSKCSHGEQGMWHPYTAYGALVEHEAVCAGYAHAMYRLCNDAGVCCRIICGDGAAGSHAWNAVQIFGKWYYRNNYQV